MRFRAAALAVCALASAWPAAAFAQDGRSLTREMAGQWELATAGRDRTCVVTLKTDAVPFGMKLDLEKGCEETLPFTSMIASWTVKGLDIVRFQDAKGEPVLDVTEVESGILEGVRSGEGVYILQGLAAARALSKSTDQMIGDWAMVRGNGNTVCGLTLTNNAAADPENFQVFLKPKCDPVVSRFAPVMWRVERGEMLLISAGGEVWRFGADDHAQWRRIPDSADPFIMVRQ
ncbi:Protease inhibitor Inh OS=Afipia felis OX=1035 GN=NCTC12722_00656 PE=4 SV=1 [Afipia felis]